MSSFDQAADRINAAVEKAEIGSEILSQVANGDEFTEVPTTSGPVPSLKKWQKDNMDLISGGVIARVDKAILSYPDYAAASAAAATLPDGQVVEARDVQERYKVQGGALVFEENLPLKELAKPTGADKVGFEYWRHGSADMTVQAVLQEYITVPALGGKRHSESSSFDNTQVMLKAFQSDQEIYLPAGDWYVTGEITATDLQRFVIHGPGRIVLSDPGGAQNVLNLLGTCKGATLRGVSLASENYTTKTGGHGIRFGGEFLTDFSVIGGVIEDIYGYGIGLQRGVIDNLTIGGGIALRRVGSDGIDIKNLQNQNRDITINGLKARDIGTLFTGDTCIDIRGQANISNVMLSPAANGYGVRFRSDEGGNGIGGHRSVLTGFQVNGGANTVAIVVDAEDVQIGAGYIEGGTIGVSCTSNSARVGVAGVSAKGQTVRSFSVDATDSTLVNCRSFDSTEGFRANAGAANATMTACRGRNAVTNIYAAAGASLTIDGYEALGTFTYGLRDFAGNTKVFNSPTLGAVPTAQTAASTATNATAFQAQRRIRLKDPVSGGDLYVPASTVTW